MVKFGAATHDNAPTTPVLTTYFALTVPAFQAGYGMGDDMPPLPARAHPSQNVPVVEHVPLAHATTIGENPLLLVTVIPLMRNGTNISWAADKNKSNILFVARAWGSGENIHGGGE